MWAVHVCVCARTRFCFFYHEHRNLCAHVGVHVQICVGVFQVSFIISVILSASGAERNHWSPNPPTPRVGMDSVGVRGGNVYGWTAEAHLPCGRCLVTRYSLI